MSRALRALGDTCTEISPCAVTSAVMGTRKDHQLPTCPLCKRGGSCETWGVSWHKGKQKCSTGALHNSNQI